MTYEVPLDIIEQVIEHLKSSHSHETINAIGMVSWGCHHLARKASFSTHNISLYANKGNETIVFLQRVPHILPYIQQLNIGVSTPTAPQIEEVIAILDEIKGLNRLYITASDPRPEDYTFSNLDFPPYEALMPPILRMPALKELKLDVDLGYGFRFTLEHVLNIHLPNCDSPMANGYAYPPPHEDNLPELHDVCVLEAVQEPFQVLPLKSLTIDLRGIESYRPFVEMLYGLFPHLYRLRLEHISMKIVAAGDNWTIPTFPRILGVLLPSQRRTLKKIEYTIWVPQQLQDPFLGLCAALEAMESENVLVTLRIEIFVFAVVCGCPSILEWKRLTDVLKRPGWNYLENVSLRISLPHESRAKQLGLDTMYRILPDTDFQPLLQQPFKFDFNLRFASNLEKY